MKLAENFPNIVEISKLAELKQELEDFEVFQFSEHFYKPNLQNFGIKFKILQEYRKNLDLK